MVAKSVLLTDLKAKEHASNRETHDFELNQEEPSESDVIGCYFPELYERSNKRT